VSVDEANVQSYRRPELIPPLVEAFDDRIGIEVNTIFLGKGTLERLQAEGDRSPPDMISRTASRA